MATTSLTLGPYWEKFVKREIANGRYASASEVIRDALCELEERGKRLEMLRAHLVEGAKQGEFVEFDVGETIARAKKRTRRFRATPRALRDLDAIADFTLARWGERQAEKYLAEKNSAFAGWRRTRALGDRATMLAKAIAAFPKAPI